ncbi:hypothetical protein CEXT_419821 [Caerostris extrusa]|uniref:Uncharacterized protein n=1 Tax=Caerostris extrusa TaxID=172846 RepID=A0AAV4T919_CAEEX|nr:hypothetical protein CEXT_419821 [Caerostris extrusa]
MSKLLSAHPKLNVSYSKKTRMSKKNDGLVPLEEEEDPIPFLYETEFQRILLNYRNALYYIIFGLGNFLPIPSSPMRPYFLLLAPDMSRSNSEECFQDIQNMQNSRHLTS